MQKRSIVFLLVFSSHLVLAQDNITKRLEEIEKSNAHESSVIELKEMLSSSTLTKEETIAVKTSLVHKYQELRQWDTCLNYCQAQVAAAHRENNSLAEASFYKLIGNTYYNIPEKDKAVEYWKKCVAICELNHHNILLEQCYHNIGSVILEGGLNYPEAEKNLQKAIQLSISNKTDTTELGNLHYRLLATLYGETNQLQKADDLYQTVIAKARQLNDSLRMAEALMFYAKVLSKESKIEEAIRIGKEALLISQKFNRLDMEQTALGLLASNYELSGNYKEAYAFLYKQNQSFTNRFNTDLNAKIGEAEARFKNAETIHEKETAILRSKKEKQVYIISIIGVLIAAIAALVYLAQKRRYNRKIEQLKMQQQVQDEKERLSKDLHDNLGSQLALLSNNVEQLDTSNKRQQKIGDEIERVKNSSKQLLQTLRETIWILHKEEISVQDFFDKLVEYTSRYLQSYPGIQLGVDENITELKIVNSNQALQLFRICQEAINNACRYSGSRSLTMKLFSLQDEVRVIIEDNGKGFDIAAINTNDHYGLQNMKQRAASIDANLRINTETGKGTSVEIIFKP